MNKKINKLAMEAVEFATMKTRAGSEIPGHLIYREKFAELLVEECAMAAELHARSYSDGDAGSGCYGAAAAVRCVGRDDE